MMLNHSKLFFHDGASPTFKGIAGPHKFWLAIDQFSIRVRFKIKWRLKEFLQLLVYTYR